jgi:hypothetical protein
MGALPRGEKPASLEGGLLKDCSRSMDTVMIGLLLLMNDEVAGWASGENFV